MGHRIVYLSDATLDLNRIYSEIAAAAGSRTADRFFVGLIAFIRALETFPERGSVRSSLIPGLRIIGYRHSISLVFIVRGNDVVIVGVFRRGQNISDEILVERL